MNKLQNDTGLFIKNGNWHPQELKEQFGQLRLSDLSFEVTKDDDLLVRIGIRVRKTIPEVLNILKKIGIS